MRSLHMRVKHGMSVGYVFKDLAQVIGVPHWRLRELIAEAFAPQEKPNAQRIRVSQ